MIRIKLEVNEVHKRKRVHQISQYYFLLINKKDKA